MKPGEFTPAGDAFPKTAIVFRETAPSRQLLLRFLVGSVRLILLSALVIIIGDSLRKIVALQEAILISHYVFVAGLGVFGGYLLWRISTDFGKSVKRKLGGATIVGLVPTMNDAVAIVEQGSNQARVSGGMTAYISRELTSIHLQPQKSDNDGIRLRPGTYTIGRGFFTDLTIHHPTVSKVHAELKITTDGFTLQDLSSTNGTFINDARLDPNLAIALQDGDQVAFGECGFRFERRARPKVTWTLAYSWDGNKYTHELHGTVIVGRDQECTLQVPGPLVSRRHCRITIVEQELTVQDLESSNGTYGRRRLRPNRIYSFTKDVVLYLGPSGHQDALKLTITRRKIKDE